MFNVPVYIGNVSAAKLSHIFITHMHGDHCYGLPGLLCSVGMGMTPRFKIDQETASPDDDDNNNRGSGIGDEKDDYSGGNGAENGQDVHLRLFGPLGLAKFIRTSLRISEAHLGYRMQINEIVPEGMTEDELNTYDREKQEAPMYYEV